MFRSNRLINCGKFNCMEYMYMERRWDGVATAGPDGKFFLAATR
jgi:hypothetical protein